MDPAITEELAAKLEGKHDRMRSLRTHAAFLLTIKCPVKCRHCINKTAKNCDTIPTKKARRRWIRNISKSNIIKAITVTGGEPFSIFETLLDLVSIIKDNQIAPAVLTSAYWATTEKSTRNWIKQIVNAGLVGICISVDKFHQEKIPIANVKRLIRVSNDCGLKVGIDYHCFEDRFYDNKAFFDLKKILGDFLKEVDSVNIGLIQKTSRLSCNFFPQHKYGAKNKLLKICTAIMPCILPDGKVTCCCGIPLAKNSPFIIGDINKESFSKIYSRFEKHPITPFLELLGLTEMMKYLKMAGMGHELKAYSGQENICQLCKNMLSQRKHVKFFIDKFNNPVVRRALGVKKLLLHGDTGLLLETTKRNENSTYSMPNYSR